MRAGRSHRAIALGMALLSGGAALGVAAETGEGGGVGTRAAGLEAPAGLQAHPLSIGTLYVPAGAGTQGSPIRLLVHFHGHPPLVCSNAAAAGWTNPVVVVNQKGLSAAYAAPFRDPEAWPRLLREATAAVNKGGGPSNRLGSIAVSSFSAGYGAVRELLRVPDAAVGIDALVLADSLYAGYVGAGAEQRPDPGQMEPFIRFARRAAAGEVGMIVTHSQQVPGSYASTRETAEVLIAAVQARREPAKTGGLWAPESVARQGGFVVLSYPGSGPQDHMNHFRRLAEALRLLEDRGAKH